MFVVLIHIEFLCPCRLRSELFPQHSIYLIFYFFSKSILPLASYLLLLKSCFSSLFISNSISSSSFLLNIHPSCYIHQWSVIITSTLALFPNFTDKPLSRQHWPFCCIPAPHCLMFRICRVLFLQSSVLRYIHSHLSIRTSRAIWKIANQAN